MKYEYTSDIVNNIIFLPFSAVPRRHMQIFRVAKGEFRVSTPYDTAPKGPRDRDVENCNRPLSFRLAVFVAWKLLSHNVLLKLWSSGALPGAADRGPLFWLPGTWREPLKLRSWTWRATGATPEEEETSSWLKLEARSVELGACSLQLAARSSLQEKSVCCWNIGLERCRARIPTASLKFTKKCDSDGWQ